MITSRLYGRTFYLEWRVSSTRFLLHCRYPIFTPSHNFTLNTILITVCIIFIAGYSGRVIRLSIDNALWFDCLLEEWEGYDNDRSEWIHVCDWTGDRSKQEWHNQGSIYQNDLIHIKISFSEYFLQINKLYECPSGEKKKAQPREEDREKEREMKLRKMKEKEKNGGGVGGANGNGKRSGFILTFWITFL